MAQDILTTWADNMVIAEFMGAMKGRCSDGVYLYAIPGLPPCSYVPRELKYHESWDWLIPVVQNIGELSEDVDMMVRFTDETSSRLMELSIFTPLPEVWLAIVAFIKWYNSQPK